MSSHRQLLDTQGPLIVRPLRQRKTLMQDNRRARSLIERSSRLRDQKAKLGSLRDSRRGERAVIIGNGPSLLKTDMAALRSEVTFGLNRVYLAFQDWGWSTDYLVSVNRLVAEQSGREMGAATCEQYFTTAANMDLYPVENEPMFLLNHRSPGFYGDVRLGIWEGATVTFVAMQLAYYMGFSEVVLVGVDHHFITKGDPHREVVSQTADPNHFSANYFGPGYRWQLPDLPTSEVAYKLARDAYHADGRTIVDATHDGALNIFPKLRLEDALR